MKTHSPLLLSLITLVVVQTAAHAQRESFDASTVTRRMEVLIVEDATGSKPESVKRHGYSADGQAFDLRASKASATFADIFFKFDSAELRDAASELKVDEMAELLKSAKYSKARILIEGHTCDLGESDYNDKLSAQRAEAIRKRLIKRGVDKDRLVALGFGEAEIVDPVSRRDSPSEAEAKRMKSRRVVLRQVLPKPAK
ncbi:MAG: OmpA family protein [Verrucomicrobiales bacterium]|nr:OmpA family protein [Verrucomicrobiales bacterium]MCP5557981.1 OmpA family protein [Verrucomicrobiaceae bacterium]